VDSLAIFCDFNGTITDRDMLVALLEYFGQRDILAKVRQASRLGTMTLRERIAVEAAGINCSFRTAGAILNRELLFDETFISFWEGCRLERVPVVVLSSGITVLIRRMLARHGLPSVPLIANDCVRAAGGWRMVFRDDTPCGNAKAPYVIAARGKGFRTALIGDDESDFEAATEANLRFAKRNSVLEEFLVEHKLRHETFDVFADIEELLFHL
jgi:2-hydroxy-3-keto-5-methylthiopentenyl-1-phosphate phosphatase